MPVHWEACAAFAELASFAMRLPAAQRAYNRNSVEKLATDVLQEPSIHASSILDRTVIYRNRCSSPLR